MALVALIVSAAKAASVPPALLLAICTHESGLKNVYTQADGGSPSIGICQVKHATARMFDKKASEYDLWKPQKNVRYAALYLARQLKRYNGNWSCAATAYNRGTVPTSLVRHSLDTKSTNCDTKYSRTVVNGVRSKSWTKIKAQGRARPRNYQ